MTMKLSFVSLQLFSSAFSSESYLFLIIKKLAWNITLTQDPSLTVESNEGGTVEQQCCQSEDQRKPRVLTASGTATPQQVFLNRGGTQQF